MRQKIQQLDLQSADFKQAPEITWTRLAEQGPVVTSRLPLLGRIALTTRYEHSQSVLRNTDQFSVDARRCGHRMAAGMRWWVPSLFKPLANNLLTVDGEEHRALRKRVDFAFRRTEIDRLQSHIEQITAVALHRLHSDMLQHGTADFVKTVARPVPQAVISWLLGLDTAYSIQDSPFNRALSSLGSVQRGSDLFRVLPGIRLILKKLKQEITARRHEPADDLLSSLVCEQGEGRALNDNELLAMVFLLYVAGHETTTHLLSTTVLSVLSAPEIREQISAPLTDKSMHEFVRFNSPVQMSKPRFVLQDMTFGGADLRRGETIAVLIGAANRDFRVFDDASTFQLNNASARHLGFGTGSHACFGLHLALRETATVVNRLLFDFPATVKLGPEADAFHWGKRLGLRSLEYLRVRPTIT